ncbi:uncharacterized protein LOC141850511 [Brevipalpus obovatus]|uniref:uncharacterized protein LOC141850511 n=1 Tax=Brevipalpus obovatus TaxID=246614 RepID=UPI003D9EE19C
MILFIFFCLMCLWTVNGQGQGKDCGPLDRKIRFENLVIPEKVVAGDTDGRISGKMVLTEDLNSDDIVAINYKKHIAFTQIPISCATSRSCPMTLDQFLRKPVNRKINDKKIYEEFLKYGANLNMEPAGHIKAGEMGLQGIPIKIDPDMLSSAQKLIANGKFTMTLKITDSRQEKVKGCLEVVTNVKF